MYLIASTNSSIPMNCVAGTLPCAYGEHVPALFWQPAIGSGNTRPSAWYEPSLVATGVAIAGAAKTDTAAVAATRATSRIKRNPRLGKPCLERSLIEAFRALRRFPGVTPQLLACSSVYACSCHRKGAVNERMEAIAGCPGDD